VDDIPIPGREEGNLVQRFVAHYDAPAYVRRARRVHDAYEALLQRCRRKRDEWLCMTRIRIGLLHMLAGEWGALLPWLADPEQVQILRQLHATLEPQLRHQVERTTSARLLRRGLRELNESITLFNRRWETFLPTVDLTHVNELRDGYNRYYLLEKECAMRSARLARQGFSRLDPVTLAELAGVLPTLPVPQLKGV
jgi:hypothetical protein